MAIEIPLAVDIDADALSVFHQVFPGANTVKADVREIFDGAPGSRLTVKERALSQEVSDVDVVLGGPPCQGHSNLNNRTRRRDSRNDLYLAMGRAAEVLRPNVIIIENVPAVVHSAERVVRKTARILEQAGFHVEEKVLDLRALGVPQKRKRHVLLAYKGPALGVLNSLSVECALHPRTVRWALRSIPRETLPVLGPATPSPANLARMSWLHDNDEYDLPNELRPPCHQSDHSYHSMYGRLNWAEPAQTITSGFGSMGQGRYVHPSRTRTLTAREAARLQMLPDFVPLGIVKTRSSIARIVGNAVPPLMSRSLMVALSSLWSTPGATSPSSAEVADGPFAVGLAGGR